MRIHKKNAIFTLILLFLLINAPSIVFAMQNNEQKLTSKRYIIDDQNLLIKKILPETDIAYFKTKFDAPENDVKVYKDENCTEEVTTGIIKTKMGVKIANSSTVYTVCVIGDLNNDGKMAEIELSNVIKHIVGLKEYNLTGLDLINADINQDEIVDQIDITAIIRWIVYKELNIIEPPTIEVVNGEKDANGTYVSDVTVKIIEGNNENLDIQKTVYILNDEKEIEIKGDETITLNKFGEYKITAYTYTEEGIKSRSTLTIKIERSIDNIEVNLDQNTFIYDGTAKEPEVIVKDGEKTLTLNTDYEVNYSNNIDAGTGTVTVTIKGKDSYIGSKTANFTINKKNINVVANPKSRAFGEANPIFDYTYSGVANGQTAKFTGELETIATISSEIGTYDITIGTLALVDNGTFLANNYKLNYTKAILTILNKNASALTVTLSEDNYIYDGTAKQPEVTVKDGETILTLNTDYEVSYSNNTNAGIATVTITVKNGTNYTGITTKDFIIEKAASKNPSLTAVNVTYDGTPHEIESSGGSGGTIYYRTSTNGIAFEDWTTTKPSLTNAGKLYVQAYVEGDSNHNNAPATESALITINKKIIEVKANEKSKIYREENPKFDFIYSGEVEGETPKFTGELESLATTNSEVGTYEITIGSLVLENNETFLANNYEINYIKASITITSKDIDSFAITLSEDCYTYDGTAKQPEVTVKDGETTLTLNTDYEASYSNNTDAGTATVTVTGNGNYSGNKTITFIINKAENPILVVGKTNLIYTGSSQKLVTVTNEKGTIYYSTDTILTSNNYTTGSTSIPTAIELGTYTVYYYATGDSNYNPKSGSVSEIKIIETPIEVGDYIDYIPDSASSYTLSSTYSGHSLDQTITQETLEWQILKKYDDGSMDLIGTPTEQFIRLYLNEGYNNGVYFINDICKKLYSKPSKNLNARSIRIEDLENLLTDAGKNSRDTNSLKLNLVPYGSTRTYTQENYYPVIYAKENGSGINTTTIKTNGIGASDLTAEGLSIPTANGMEQANSGLTVTQTAYSVIINEENFGDEYKILTKNAPSSQLVETYDYWIATRCVDCIEIYDYGNLANEYASFGIFTASNHVSGKYENGEVVLYGHNMIGSHGGTQIFWVYSSSLRPIITLSANSKVEACIGINSQTNTHKIIEY